MSSGNNNTGALVTFAIKVSGNAIPDVMMVQSVLVEKKVNRIASASIVILDGNADTGKFDASSSATFLPGNEISIEAGYDSVNQLIFKGIITRQSIRIDGSAGSTLEVECMDAAVKMTVGRKCLSFDSKKDSEVISSLIAAYSDLTASVTATDTAWPGQVQYYVSDWDFMLCRAEANGFIVTTINGTVTVAKPGADSSSILTITYGDGLYELHASLNAITQLGSVKASTWDYKNQAVSSGQASNELAGPGNLSSKKLSEVIGLNSFQLQSTVPYENADLTNWSKAQLIKTEYAKIQGDVKFAGNSSVDPGKFISLAGVGDRFAGDHFVSAVEHDISDGNWFTTATIGLSPAWFTEEPDLLSPSASGLVPGVRGLMNGTVKKIFDDPDTQYRILVDVPLFDENGAGIWARLSNFYSTSGAGAFFLPEVGDEVVLGFLNEDPRYPVILGSMYSSSKLKPYTDLDPNEENKLKAIVSKSGMYITFNDVDKILTISTPEKNTVILSEKDKQISIKDQNSNSIVLSETGIDIKSLKDINISADQKITIKGMQGVQVQSDAGDVEISGLNIKETADIQYSSNGGATSKITSGAEMTIQSAMVMIN